MNNHTESNWRNLIAACAAITVFGFAFGTTYPLLSLLLEDRGISTNMIGINAAMMPIGILLFSGVIPIISQRYGSRIVAILAALITAFLVLGYKIFDSLEAWFILRLLQGMSISTLFVLSEAWIVQFSSDQHRGRIVAIYGSILAASFGAGPALIGWIGIHGWAPFIIGFIVVLAGVVPLFYIDESKSPAAEETAASSIMSFMPKAPTLLLAVVIFGIYDAAVLSLLPIYGLQSGLDLPTAANALTALIVGNVIFQFPIGWLADKYPKRLILGCCAGLTAVFMAMLPWVIGKPLMWPVLILAGTFGYGIYSVSLAALGDRFRGQELVTGSSAFAVMWGIGALVGSVGGGLSMQIFGLHGLPFFICVTYLILLVFLLLRTWSLWANKKIA
ncbi:MAG: MFS family permease [Parasphingorhabdus sp.]|jgi:MFS family permease